MPIFQDGVMSLTTARELERAPVSRKREMSLQSFAAVHFTRGAGIVSTNEAWRSSMWVRLCVTKIAESIAQLKFQIQVSKDESKVEKHPVLDLIARPNSDLSTFELWYQTVLILQLYGEVFWLLGKKSAGMLLFHPHGAKEKVERSTGELLGWHFRLPDGSWSKPVLKDDVVHIRIYDPTKPYRGSSPLESVGLSVSSDLAALRHNLDFFERGAVPDGVLTTTEEIDTDAADAIREKWKAVHQNKGHEVAVLHSGMTYNVTHVSAREAEFIGGRKMNREEICAAFSVPLIMLAGTEGTTYANLESAIKGFWELKLKPTMQLICSAIDKQIVKDPRLESGFDLSKIEALKKSHEAQAAIAEKYFGMGYPLNAINKVLKLGFEPVAHGDMGFLPFSLNPVEQILEPDPIGDDSLPPPEKDEKQDPKLDKAFDFDRMLERIGQTSAIAVRAAKKDKVSAAVKLIKDQDGKLKSISSSFFKQAYKIGIDQVNESLTLDVKFNLKNPRAVEFLKDKEIRITQINEATAEKVRTILLKGLEDGNSIEEVQKLVKAAYRDFEGYRARLISRTEISQSVNGGRFGTLIEEGVANHEWIDSGDERVRDSHAQEHGSIVAVGDPFPVTKLTFPGDPDGDPEEIINCRCVTLPEDSKRAVRIDPKKYWRAAVAQWTPTENRYARSLKKYFYEQGSAIQKLLAE